MIEVPYEAISPDTLLALIESFVLREGTDYGEIELSLDQKVKRVEKQLASKKLCILFDESEETCTIVNRDELQRHFQL